jgi:AraC family transcriptional regulator
MGTLDKALVGNRFGRHFSIPVASSINITSLSNLEIGLTRITMETAPATPGPRMPAQKAFNVSLHLRRPQIVREWGTWTNGKFRRVTGWELGGVGIYDFETDPVVLRDSGMDAVVIYVPRQTLDAYAEEGERTRVDTLQGEEGARDDVLLHWCHCLLPYFSRNCSLSQLALDHHVMLLCAHLSRRYNVARVPEKLMTGGLAIWQQRRAIDMLHSDLKGTLGLQAVALECGLSVSRFAKAFRVSFGMPAHRYLITQRIHVAQVLMRQTRLALTDIALEAGFTDQAAFSRTFSSLVGTTPSAWRREHATAPALAAVPRDGISA